MRACRRGPAPALLERDGAALGRAYAARRRQEPSYRFQWPHREGQRLYDVTRAALAIMTDGRCSYCDGFPIDAMGSESVDHFRPKSRPEFYELVCAWDNLFLVCSACNHAKSDQWDERLAKPDLPDYEFERFFSYRADTGELLPNPTASVDDQAAAKTTIELLKLNRAGACKLRQTTMRALITSGGAQEDTPYRYLIPLCRSG